MYFSFFCKCKDTIFLKQTNYYALFKVLFILKISRCGLSILFYRFLPLEICLFG